MCEVALIDLPVELRQLTEQLPLARIGLAVIFSHQHDSSPQQPAAAGGLLI
jgi:hypothetical protein